MHTNVIVCSNTIHGEEESCLVVLVCHDYLNLNTSMFCEKISTEFFFSNVMRNV